MTDKQKTTKKERNFPLKRLYFYLTEGCNLKCCHCWLSPKYQTGDHTYSYLSLELFEWIVQQAKPLGLTDIKLTGGEPLLHPDIMKILEMIQHHDTRLTLETNGTLCTYELAHKISECKQAFVSVSLDAASREIHDWIRGVKGSFDDAIKGIKNIVKAGLSPQIIVSVMRHNLDQLEEIVDLAESLGANSVKFNIVQPSGRGKKLKEVGETLTVEGLIKLGHWVENELAPTKRIHVIFNHPPAFRPLRKLFAKNGIGFNSCGLLEIMGVLPKGFYALCGIGTQVPELLFGDAKTDRLEDTWNNSNVLVALREGIPHRFKGICGNCLMVKFCMGECIAQNYFTTKSLWESYWFCDEAYKLSLFPKTRVRSVPSSFF